jgi:hypothetical protein
MADVSVDVATLDYLPNDARAWAGANVEIVEIVVPRMCRFRLLVLRGSRVMPHAFSTSRI